MKTCTGFSGGAASVQDVNLMAKTIKYKGGYVKVKASAGVRDFKTCLAMFKAGAERIGTCVFIFFYSLVWFDLGSFLLMLKFVDPLVHQ